MCACRRPVRRGFKPGLHATLTLPEYPGRSFDATLTRTADAVDPQSGTVLVELQAPNGDGALKPGAYAQVRFPITGTGGAVTLPASAVLYRSDGHAGGGGRRAGPRDAARDHDRS